MKKFLALIALAVSGAAFAGSAAIEYQGVDNRNGDNAQKVQLTFRENLNNVVAADVRISNTWADNTKALSTRVEGGLTGTLPVAKGIDLYTRGAVGQKFVDGNNFTYYSVEPGVTARLADTPFTARVGYRYRTAFDSADNDTTRTLRVGLSYALTKVDSVGVRFDRVRGDADQNIYAVNYTRSF